MAGWRRDRARRYLALDPYDFVHQALADEPARLRAITAEQSTITLVEGQEMRQFGVRLTIRRIMFAVAVAALLLTLGRMWARRAYCLQLLKTLFADAVGVKRDSPRRDEEHPVLPSILPSRSLRLRGEKVGLRSSVDKSM
jgi:hypothetical protein